MARHRLGYCISRYQIESLWARALRMAKSEPGLTSTPGVRALSLLQTWYCPDAGTAIEQQSQPQEYLQPATVEEDKSILEKFLNPEKDEMPYQVTMPIWDHLDELRERVIVGAAAAVLAILTCFAFSKDLVIFLEAPVASQGVRFLQLSPGEFFFTTMKVCCCPFASKLGLCECQVSRVMRSAYNTRGTPMFAMAVQAFFDIDLTDISLSARV